ncbi:MAG: site-specific integrase [Bacteroidales bacterium]|nr:site-specific integrase [Bacteroidales bacterium]
MCALQWRDIDLENNEFHISKTVQRVFLSDGPDKEYYISLGPPKTPSSHRDIPLSDELIKILGPLKGIVNEDYFVVSNAPDPLEPRYYRDYFKKLMKNLGLPPVRFHCLRHTFANRCIEGKCDYKTVSAILGHASLATTMDIYVHPGHDDKKRCIDQMAGLIGG